MRTVKAVYMPLRRYFFLDDDEEFHASDITFLVALPVLTTIILLACFIATFGNN